jgi:hypothetical protein
MYKNFDHQMSLSMSKYLYSNYSLHFSKRAVPLARVFVPGKQFYSGLMFAVKKHNTRPVTNTLVFIAWMAMTNLKVL